MMEKITNPANIDVPEFTIEMMMASLSCSDSCRVRIRIRVRIRLAFRTIRGYCWLVIKRGWKNVMEFQGKGREFTRRKKAKEKRWKKKDVRKEV